MGASVPLHVVPVRRRTARGTSEREHLRHKGQFWTPEWIADAMVAYVLSEGIDELFDPAVGEGAFLVAALRRAECLGRHIRLLGTELDADLARSVDRVRLAELGAAEVQHSDFIRHPPNRMFRGIVANPPYVRHHRLTLETKEHLRRLCMRTLGVTIDGRAGLHVYFLIQALRLLDSGGRLAFILPADTFEGVFALTLWSWILRRFALDAVLTFDPEATPFPDVDTNPVIVFVRNAAPVDETTWGRVHRHMPDELPQWTAAGCPALSASWLSAQRRSVAELLTTGLSRPPSELSLSQFVLGDYARVMRGIATGDNAFFLLTRMQARSLDIGEEWLRPAIARTRDVTGDVLTAEDLNVLEQRGRPTRLLCLDGRDIEKLPDAVRAYLRQGMMRGLPDRPLISQRKPWYRMETRLVPPILFAYLGRRNVRFILNEAGALPLTGFLGVYPHMHDADSVERVWKAVSHPATVTNLAIVGKSYGSGAIKVEPRALERLPLPAVAVQAAGLVCRRLNL